MEMSSIKCSLKYKIGYFKHDLPRRIPGGPTPCEDFVHNINIFQFNILYILQHI